VAYYVFRALLFFKGTQEGYAVFLVEKVTKNQDEKKLLPALRFKFSQESDLKRHSRLRRPAFFVRPPLF
jgi:hypothetical protein